MEEIVGIDVGGNTVDAILNITGNEPDEDIILEIIEHYARMFAECDKGSGYRFVMLTNKIREHYEQYADNKRKRTIARQVEDCWRKKEKEEEINFELITSPSPKSSKKSHRMQFLYEEFLKTDNKAPLTAESSIDDYDIETSKMFKTLEQLTGKPIVPYDESNDLYPEWQ